MKKFFSFLAIVSVLTLGLAGIAKSEDKHFLVKGDLGWNIYPGLFGYLLYMESYSDTPYDSLGMSSGLSLSGDFLYVINPMFSVGLNVACLPFFQFKDVGNVSVNCELIPVLAEVQFNPVKFFYLDLGLGLGFVHGSGTSSSSSVTFFDMVANVNTGQSFNVFRGPYFILAWGYGFQIDLSGQDSFGIDIGMKFNSIFGHEGINELAALAEQYAKVPGFLLMFMVNTGAGVYFRF